MPIAFPDMPNHSLSILDDATAAELSRIGRVYSQRSNQVQYTLFDPAYLLACHEREERMLAAFARHGFVPLENAKILEIGCGEGFWLREFVRWGARPENIVGIDVLPERVDEARKLCAPGIALKCENAAKLAFPDDSFDLVLQSTVFTSVLDENMRVNVACEMLRVLRPKGVLMWYDFTVNNPSNPNVRGVPRREIRRLFPGCRFEFQRLTLAPPIGRRIAPVSSFIYRVVSAARVFDTHCLAIIQKTC